MNIEQIYTLFPLRGDCISYLESVRWKGKPVCPYCNGAYTTPLPLEQRHHCNPCNVAFSVIVRTMFHHTRLPLQKWFLAIYLISSSPKRLSVRHIAQNVEVNKNTASRLILQIRRAWREPRQKELLMQIIEFTHTTKTGESYE